MSALQEQAIQMIDGLSDENVQFLIEVIKRLMPQELNLKTDRPLHEDASMQAFHRLDEARMEMSQYLPENFDPDKELEEARAERYGSIS